MTSYFNRNSFCCTSLISSDNSCQISDFRKRFSMIDSNNLLKVEVSEKSGIGDWRLYSTFKKDEYVEAMVEDLCDWFNFLYNLQSENKITVNTFFKQLQDGVILNKHAATVQNLAEDYLKVINSSSRKLPLKIGNQVTNVPDAPPTYVNVDFTKKINEYHKRDNVSNFIQWCRNFNIPVSLTFETEDLIMLKNPRNVVVCLLEVARIGRLFGMEVPDIIQLEEEIEKEIKKEANIFNSNEELKILNHDDSIPNDRVEMIVNENSDSHMKKSNIPVMNKTEKISKESQVDLPDTSSINIINEEGIALRSKDNRPRASSTVNNFQYCNGSKIDNSDNESVVSYGSQYLIPKHKFFRPVGRVKIYDCFDKSKLVKDRKYREVCDMRSLDERVREILSECRCSETFPMKRISDGRYQWGDKKILIFVRILRNHVMVRVGGGWDTLNEFLKKHDHCRKERSESISVFQKPFPLIESKKFIKPSVSCCDNLKNVTGTATIEMRKHETPFDFFRYKELPERRYTIIPKMETNEDFVDAPPAIISPKSPNFTQNKTAFQYQPTFISHDDELKKSDNKENTSAISFSREFQHLPDNSSLIKDQSLTLSDKVDKEIIQSNAKKFSRIPVLKKR